MALGRCGRGGGRRDGGGGGWLVGYPPIISCSMNLLH